MNTSTAVLQLFREDTEKDEAEIQPPPSFLGMAAATARLVAYRDTQYEDGEQRALLVVDCPFCDHQHIHPAGLASAPRVCPRTSRCVGRSTGVYYFPAVTQ
ncbi:hypothetical protein SCAB_48521 [Streptomyces scabiei 87.22]|uniref:Uncharacterized protein n=1 Tax=Streptomyces scabiei (strain 87.22) TaxID=680198 RepID=C9ZFB7_STRSW|nr:hypothetical protein [Streptomyces scabiei]MDX2891443.1 hypothetical protein [Streptomyces scabiei]MDX2904892.1 hypothetical protein [Streptomyces scabiei]MDX2994493.1 hypothetical protein [Streptomyces scabiei]MDX3084737.1 hypothetical protein [Streptomyces scabiei]MDX3137865.1 hypothetical protein [Streptomyces scabiei]